MGRDISPMILLYGTRKVKAKESDYTIKGTETRTRRFERIRNWSGFLCYTRPVA